MTPVFLKTLVWLGLFMILYSCASPKTAGDPPSGVAILITRKYDTASRTYIKNPIFPEFKMWYKDSCVIQAITTVSIYNDGRKSEITQKLNHYALMNLRTGKMYDFSSFSDTARLLKIYPRYTDTMRVEGLNLFSRARASFTRAPVPLRDTTIDHHLYKRYKVYYLNQYQDPPGEQATIAYGDCEKANTIFQFFKGLLDKNCPITRTDDVPSKLIIFPFSMEFRFVSDTLSQKELKVFKSWQDRLVQATNR